VSQNQDERDVEHAYRVLERANNRVGDDLTGVPHNEKVAEARIEDDFGGQPRVGTPKQGNRRILGILELREPLDVLVRVSGLTRGKPLVTKSKFCPRV
jgi:hypothetical protein